MKLGARAGTQRAECWGGRIQGVGSARALTIPLIAALLTAPACRPGVAETPTPTHAVDDCGAPEGVVQIQYDDAGFEWTADWWPAAAPTAPAVLLLHMIPPHYDRSSYPQRVRQRLHDQGWAVLNVDRRGAGDTPGVPEDAYIGPGGLQDVSASVNFLVSAAGRCHADPTRVALVAASNGTTAAWDYHVGHDPSLPGPRAMIFMSPGSYTENQHPVSAAGAPPILWLYPTTEPWSRTFAGQSSDWEFIERGDQHGTGMFDGGQLEQDTLNDMLRFLDEHLAD